MDEEYLLKESIIRYPDVDEWILKMAVQGFLKGVYKDKDGNTIDENELEPSLRKVLIS